MQAADVMVRDVIAVGPNATWPRRRSSWRINDVSALLVVDDDGHLIGIISEADLMRREEIGTDIQHQWSVEAMTPASTLAAEFAKSHGKRVAELMSENVITAAEDTPLAEIAAILERNRVNRVPTMQNGELVGIVSRANLIQALASSPIAAGARLDESRTIRHELLSRLGEQSWTDFGSRNVIVTEGEVHLLGSCRLGSRAQGARCGRRGVPGVTGVVD